jgi:hypothetical protein
MIPLVLLAMAVSFAAGVVATCIAWACLNRDARGGYIELTKR